MSGSRPHTIDGPEQDHLTRSEVAKYLRLELHTLKRLIAAGEFPGPFQFSPRVWVWSWEEVVAWAIMRKIAHRCQPKPEDVPPLKGAGGGTSSVHGGDHGGTSSKRGKVDG